MLKTGDRYKNFVVKRSLALPEINCGLLELVHEKTGATVMHIANDDDENLFCISFQTFPKSSNGAPHILEHTVLCGSDKFPVKDPFFAMTRRSLNTFMNAMTGDDFTCYPAASQIEKDFYNLLDVYIDAVFHPQIKKESFLQEGHRLEFVKGKLVRKGVVYNEMKGSLNSCDSRLRQYIKQALFPDLSYQYNSGGDPKIIPSLTYEELVAFHKTFYHPSRSIFFFYGNIPLEKHLDFIEEKALKNVKKTPPLPQIAKQKRFKKPIFMKKSFPSSSKEDKKTFSISYLTTSIENQEELLALILLDQILMQNDASPLKAAILKSKLATSLASYFEEDMSEIPWTLILKGCTDDGKKIIDLFQNTLKKIEIGADLVEAALHQLEFERTEIQEESVPYGLLLFFRSVLIKQHGADPKDALSIHTLFKSLAAKIKKKGFFQALIEKYFLKNRHAVYLLMVPDLNLENREREEEKKGLLKLSKSLNSKEKGAIRKETKNFADYQKKESKKSVECLPKIRLDEVPQTVKEYPLEEEKAGNLNIFHHDVFTNKIVYAELVIDLPAIKDQFLLSLFTTLLPEIGNKKRDYRKNLNYINRFTGGFEAYLTAHNSGKDINRCSPSFGIKGKALLRNAKELFLLFRDTLDGLDFRDERRIKELVLKNYSILENSITRNAMAYAKSLAARNLNVAYLLNEKWHGLSYFEKLKALVNDLNPSRLIEAFTLLKELLLTRESTQLVIGCDKESYQKIREEEFFGLTDIKLKPHKPWDFKFKPEPGLLEARSIASPVAFNCMAFPTIGYDNPASATIFVASYLLENEILHSLIREKGGAYGSGATYSPMQGGFSFHSYRDPNLSKTIDAFKHSLEEIVKANFEEKAVEEAKLSALQHIDSPIPPGQRAIYAYNWIRTQKSYAMRQAFRSKVLSTTKKEIVEVVKKLLIPDSKSSNIVAFASKEFLTKENRELNKPLKIFMV